MASGTELRILAMYEGREEFMRRVEQRIREVVEVEHFTCPTCGDPHGLAPGQCAPCWIAGRTEAPRMYTERLTGDALDGHKANVEKVKVDLDHIKEYLPERLRAEAQKVKDTLGEWEDKLDKGLGTKDR